MKTPFKITRYGSRYWAVWSPDELLCVTVYRRRRRRRRSHLHPLETNPP